MERWFSRCLCNFLTVALVLGSVPASTGAQEAQPEKDRQFSQVQKSNPYTPADFTSIQNVVEPLPIPGTVPRSSSYAPVNTTPVTQSRNTHNFFNQRSVASSEDKSVKPEKPAESAEDAKQQEPAELSLSDRLAVPEEKTEPRSGANEPAPITSVENPNAVPAQKVDTIQLKTEESSAYQEQPQQSVVTGEERADLQIRQEQNAPLSEEKSTDEEARVADGQQAVDESRSEERAEQERQDQERESSQPVEVEENPAPVSSVEPAENLETRKEESTPVAEQTQPEPAPGQGTLAEALQSVQQSLAGVEAQVEELLLDSPLAEQELEQEPELQAGEYLNIVDQVRVVGQPTQFGAELSNPGDQDVEVTLLLAGEDPNAPRRQVKITLAAGETRKISLETVFRKTEVGTFKMRLLILKEEAQGRKQTVAMSESFVLEIRDKEKPDQVKIVLQEWAFNNAAASAWTPERDIRNLEIYNGALEGEITGPRPALVSPKFELPAAQVQVIEMRIRYTPPADVRLDPGKEVLRLSWRTLDMPVGEFSAPVEIPFSQLKKDGDGYYTVSIDTRSLVQPQAVPDRTAAPAHVRDNTRQPLPAALPGPIGKLVWRGVITHIKVEPLSPGKAGVRFSIDSVSFKSRHELPQAPVPDLNGPQFNAPVTLPGLGTPLFMIGVV
ncbi:MAG: hypothetical protein JW937_01125 [Candidatus Omnitrophica bacterium]|nr:hypothetical protein [Candidatus Omnitrophota bacterium]